MALGRFSIDYDPYSKRLVINVPYGQSFEDYAPSMGALISKILEIKAEPRITVVAEAREYTYSDEECRMLFEIAGLIEEIRKQNFISLKNILKGSYCEDYLPNAFAKIRAAIENIKYDPVSAYLTVVRETRMIKHKIKKLKEGEDIEETKGGDKNACRVCFTHYLLKVLMPLRKMFEETAMIKRARELKIRGRTIYRKLFRPSTRPTFMYTRLETSFPENAELIDRYRVGDAIISIFRIAGKVERFYHLSAGEFNMNYEEYEILERARRYIGAHEPSEAELAEPDLFRKNMFNLAVDLIRDISQTENKDIDEQGMQRLANILARYTAGMGIIEILLADENIQDILINSPVGAIPVFIRHAEFGDCITNIYPSASDAEAWATRFRIQSGRPLDEANPVLDTEIEVKGGRARVAAITRPLSPDGIAFALRRFRQKPWTLPLFINTKMLDAFSAGLIWFLIDGARTILVAGTRSSGKCVEGNSIISMGNGELVKIKDIVEYQIKEKAINTEDGFLCTPDDLHVTSLGEDMRMKKHKVKALYKRRAPKKLIRIKTASGRTITTTPEHIYFTVDNGIKEIRAEMLCEGSCIAAARMLPHANSFENFDLAPLQHEEGIYVKMDEKAKAVPLSLLKASPEELWIKSKTAGFAVKVPKKITPELAELLGYLAGDGHVDMAEVAFFNTVEEMRNRAGLLMKKCFGHDPSTNFPKKRSPMVVIRSNALAKVFRSVFGFPIGKKSENFVLPSWTLGMSKENTSRFIRAYFDCDGSVGDRGIEFATASRDVAQKMQLMLLKFGIISFLKPKIVKGKEYHRIMITGENIDIFAREIGFLHPRKHAILQSKIGKIRKGHYTNVDTVPGVGAVVKKTIKALEIETHGEFWVYCNETCSFGRKKLGKFVSLAERRLHNLSLIYSLHYDLTEYARKTRMLANLVKDNPLPANLAEAAGRAGISARIFKKYKKGCPDPRPETSGKILGYFGMRAEISDETKMLNSLRHAVQLISHKRMGEASGISVGTISGIARGRYRRPRLKIVEGICKGLEIICREISEAERNIKMIKQLADSDIFWDKIAKIEHIKPEEEFVYDIEVEGSPNFVANGIIAHNTSFLGSCMVQIMPNVRVITVEDTLELPVNSLRDIGFNVERLKSRSVITRIETELPAEEALRTALRLGDSALIVGEVRSREALALYEAMRIGALANVVAGTIHGESAYGVFDRVVNDLGVPPTSFKATDIVIIANTLRSPDGLRTFRRIVEITEVRKHWQKDPLQENGFVPLMQYNAAEDKLKPTQTLLTGESEVLNNIASRVKEWSLNWEAVWDNVNLRSRILHTLAEEGKRKPELIEAESMVKSNSAFHTAMDEVLRESGTLDSPEIYKRWSVWLKDYMIRV
ncbi:MAG: Flp pilus assembly complex ATPase component TadA [Candidatus Aenigmarchaeota archaeon]|nr:Flp pilus assembly complex ATPase component TadA [Candidatus Aenigmarchaeota archaeon]